MQWGPGHPLGSRAQRVNQRRGSFRLASAVLQTRARDLYRSYVGWGAPAPGVHAEKALQAMAAAAAAEVAGRAGKVPEYRWPQQAPRLLPPTLHVGEPAWERVERGAGQW
jgi:hypothetical protein